MLVDTHCHLFMEPLCSDPAGVLRRALEAGVDRVVVPAFDTGSRERVMGLSRHPGVFPALGLHPWKADEDLDIPALGQELESSVSVAVGEIGLDFKLDTPGREVQIAVFRAQLDLALELDLPVILHCRGAFEEMASILSDERYRGMIRGVVHAFTRGTELAGRFLGLGLHLAFGGAVTRPGAKRARRSAAVVPMDRMLLETDSPSIGMYGLEPEEVEPAHIGRVAGAIAGLRGISLDETARITTVNAERLFGLHGS
ncbi:MAG: TatD family hydrolase [Candidatus Fermentibacteraceae bacterium]|nr:TatD family hydrolase [Candidatus Fermentibacteraceae bacterium]